jgi:hypothetical protein
MLHVDLIRPARNGGHPVPAIQRLTNHMGANLSGCSVDDDIQRFSGMRRAGGYQ